MIVSCDIYKIGKQLSAKQTNKQINKQTIKQGNRQTISILIEFEMQLQRFGKYITPDKKGYPQNILLISPQTYVVGTH